MRCAVMIHSSLRTRMSHASPAERLALLRIVIGGYALLFVFVRFPHLWNSAGYPSTRWESVGVLSPLSNPPTPFVTRALLIIAIPVGCGYVLGWRYRITGPTFALLFLLITTFRFSWGSVLHTEHLVVIHVMIIGLSTAHHALTIKKPAVLSNKTPNSYHWAIEACAITTVVGYTVSGIAKLRYGGWDWLSGDVLRNQIAFDNLRKILLGDIHSPVAGWMINNDAPLKVLAPLTVIFELSAPLALLHAALRKTWIIGIWLFHVGVLVLMAIVFPYQLTAVAYLPVMFMTPFLQLRLQRNVPSRDPVPVSQQHWRSTSN